MLVDLNVLRDVANEFHRLKIELGEKKEELEELLHVILDDIQDEEIANRLNIILKRIETDYCNIMKIEFAVNKIIEQYEKNENEIIDNYEYTVKGKTGKTVDILGLINNFNI